MAKRDATARNERATCRVTRTLLTAVFVATTACGGDNSSSVPYSTAVPDIVTRAPTISVPPLQTQPPVGTTHLVIEGSFETEQGYRYGLDVDLTLSPPAKNVLNSNPGFAAIERQYSSSSEWTLSNQLSDRNSRYDDSGRNLNLGVWGFFRADRPICKAIKPKPYFFIKFNGKLGRTCGLNFGDLLSDPPTGAVLPPNGSISGGFTIFATSTRGAWQLQAVPETIVDDAMADLAEGPDATAVILKNALTVTGWRTPFGDSFDDDTACLIEPTGGISGTGLILFLTSGTEARGLTQHNECH